MYKLAPLTTYRKFPFLDGMQHAYPIQVFEFTIKNVFFSYFSSGFGRRAKIAQCSFVLH